MGEINSLLNMYKITGNRYDMNDNSFTLYDDYKNIYTGESSFNNSINYNNYHSYSFNKSTSEPTTTTTTTLYDEESNLACVMKNYHENNEHDNSHDNEHRYSRDNFTGIGINFSHTEGEENNNNPYKMQLILKYKEENGNTPPYNITMEAELNATMGQFINDFIPNYIKIVSSSGPAIFNIYFYNSGDPLTVFSDDVYSDNSMFYGIINLLIGTEFHFYKNYYDSSLIEQSTESIPHVYIEKYNINNDLIATLSKINNISIDKNITYKLDYENFDESVMPDKMIIIKTLNSNNIEKNPRSYERDTIYEVSNSSIFNDFPDKAVDLNGKKFDNNKPTTGQLFKITFGVDDGNTIQIDEDQRKGIIVFIKYKIKICITHGYNNLLQNTLSFQSHYNSYNSYKTETFNLLNTTASENIYNFTIGIMNINELVEESPSNSIYLELSKPINFSGKYLGVNIRGQWNNVTPNNTTKFDLYTPELGINSATYYKEVPVIDSMEIIAHGITIYRNMNESFYNSYLPYRFGSNINTPEDRGLYMINFNFNPGDYQPSGHINLSRAREFYLKYSSKYDLSDPKYKCDLLVNSRAINFLLIKDGSAVLRYST